MRKLIVAALILPALLWMAASMPIGNRNTRFHTPQERYLFSSMRRAFPPSDSLPANHLLLIDSSTMWPTSRTCKGCHGFDSLGFALVTTSGVDVNVYDDWSATMMANAAKDPFWRAKVRHEILVNPAHSAALQNKCTSCHAPAGHFQALLKEQKSHYGLSDLYADTLGLDGVTCQVCHATGQKNLGFQHSGNLLFDTNQIRVAFGPYEFIQAGPMRDFVGITPQYADHISDAGLCAGCHTLITESVDLTGNFTGSTFTEQATYHEWLNSVYDKTHQNVTCQKCHMPQLLDEIIIATNYQFLTPKYPFGLHELAGANAFMLKLLKNNRSELGIQATAAAFDSSIAATLRQLQTQTLEMHLTADRLDGDTAYFSLELVNKAGHKFPSGYPSRRAWVEFLLQTDGGDTVFHSGALSADYRLQYEDQNFEPHHAIIRSPEDVQIYELIPGDVNGNFTSMLERANVALKDNRLCPKGFSTNDPAYDTTEIVGAALTDPDFNRTSSGTEGTGADVVRLHVANPGLTGTIKVTARVWYQSIAPRWLDEMFDATSPEIEFFRQMYQQADQAPVLVGEVKLDTLIYLVPSKEPASLAGLNVFPTLTEAGIIYVDVPAGVQISTIEVFSQNGKRVIATSTREIILPVKNAVYFVRIRTNFGEKTVKVFYSEK